MKNINVGIVVLISLCMGSGWLRAQDGADSKAGVGTTPRILADIEAARKEKDKKLDAAFQKAIHAVKDSDNISRGRSEMVVADLKSAQTAWQDFRRKQSGFLASYYYEEIGSPGARAAGIWEYESHLIDQRIKELENPPNFF